MKGQSCWDYHPYLPLGQHKRSGKIYINRIVPSEHSIELHWTDHFSSGPYVVLYRDCLGAELWSRLACRSSPALLENLCPGHDYEFSVHPANAVNTERGSLIRLAGCGSTVGTVVNYLHRDDPAYAFSGRYLCSPSLVMLPDGALLASMDVYGKESPQNLTMVFRSDNRGRDWIHIADLFPCFWGKLFVNRKALYMLGFTAEYGNLVIGKSDDGGLSWSDPVTLFPGSGMWKEKGPHRAPMPVVEYKNRLWTSLDYGCWAKGGHASGVLSIDAGADLMLAGNWLSSGFTSYNPGWPGAAIGPSPGALEGNMVSGPTGDLYNLLRYQMTGCTPAFGKAIMLKVNVSDPEAPPDFYRIIDFNGGSNAKFSLLYDDESRAYLAIVNEVVQPGFPAQRNVLSLAVSYDLENWHIAKQLMDHREEDWRQVGFQYVDFLIDANDILFLCRTAMAGAASYHDSNMITFHVIEDFRSLIECCK